MIDRETKLNLLQHISEDELYDNWLPIDDKTIEETLTFLSDKESGRYSKKNLNTPYGISNDKETKPEAVYLIYRKKIGIYAYKEEIPVNIRFNKKGIYTFHEVKEEDRIFYEIYKEYKVGKGGSGDVKLGINLLTKKIAALKTQKIGAPIEYKVFQQEYRNLQELKKAESISFERVSKKEKHIRKGEFWLSYESGENIDRLMQKRQDPKRPESGWPNLLWIEIGLLILKELDHFLHSKHLAHFDLKPSNIHFDLARYSIRILDVTNVLKFKPDEKEGENIPSIKKIIQYTPEYLAPEVRSQKVSRIHPKMDIYSLGKTFEEIFLNREIIDTNDDTGESEIIDLKNPIHLRGNDGAKTIINQMQDDLKKRLSLKESIDKLQKFHDDYAKDHPEEVILIEQLKKDSIDKENKKLKSATEEIAKHKQPAAPLKRRLLSQEEVYPLTFPERHPYLVRALKWTISTVRQYCSRKKSSAEETLAVPRSSKGTNTYEIASHLNIRPAQPSENKISDKIDQQESAAISKMTPEHNNEPANNRRPPLLYRV